MMDVFYESSSHHALVLSCDEPFFLIIRYFMSTPSYTFYDHNKGPVRSVIFSPDGINLLYSTVPRLLEGLVALYQLNVVHHWTYALIQGSDWRQFVIESMLL